jgi:hypothetical protein
MKLNGSKRKLITILVICIFVATFPFLAMGEESTVATDAEATPQTIDTTTESQLAKESEETAAVTTTAIKLTEVTADTLKANNEQLELFIDELNGQIRLHDRLSGKNWFGAPPVDSKMPPNNQKIVANPINIYYTLGKEIVTTYPEKEKAKLTISDIEGGVRVDYNIETLGLAFAMEYRLLNNGVDMTIPYDSIRETANARLTGLEPLPFFESASPGDEGALFIPDGSGALLNFNKNKPASFEFYSEPIYGGDHAFQIKVYEQVGAIRFETVSKSPQEHIALPVFGLYKADQAFLGIVTKGAADAKINAYPNGVRNIPLYRISTEFVYRNDDIIFVGNSGEIPMTELDMIQGDRSIRFVTLQEDKANYVGMAESYRDYLIEEQGMVAVNDNKAKLQLRLFGGVLRDEILGDTFIEMTTFNEAKTIIDKFLNQGVEAIEVTYEGWSNDGYLGNQPEHFPAEGALGGNKDLKKLSAYLEEKGIPLYLEANYVKPYSGSDEVKASKDVIRGLNKEILNLYKPYEGTLQHSRELYYLLKPEKVFNEYIKEEAGDFEESGASGVLLQHMGELIYSDHDQLPAFRRSQTIDTWVKSINLMRDKVGRASVEYGMAYTLGSIDRIDNIPMDSSHYTILDETIPFYQIAVHGYIPYNAKPANLSDDPRVYKLRALEFGAMPSYELTYEESSKLKRTLIVELFSTAYKNWTESAVEQYHELETILGPLADQKIIDHKNMLDHVKKTTYEDGTEIILNYNPFDVTIEGQTIQGFDYAVLKGGNGS